MKYKRISASSIRQWKYCQYDWVQQRVNGFKSPSTPAMERGTLIHKILENYVNGVLMSEYPQGWDKGIEDAQAYIHRLGSFTKKTEVRLSEDLGDGFVLVGYIDLLLFHSQEKTVTIVDYKTKRSVSDCLSTRALQSDLQMQLYARLVALKYPGYSIQYTHLNILQDHSRFTRAVTVDLETTLNYTSAELREHLKEIKKADFESITRNTCQHKHTYKEDDTMRVEDNEKFTNLKVILKDILEKQGQNTPSGLLEIAKHEDTGYLRLHLSTVEKALAELVTEEAVEKLGEYYYLSGDAPETRHRLPAGAAIAFVGCLPQFSEEWRPLTIWQYLRDELEEYEAKKGPLLLSQYREGEKQAAALLYRKLRAETNRPDLIVDSRGWGYLEFSQTLARVGYFFVKGVN